MSMIDPLASARGHGSAEKGVSHWFHQRASALFLIPLSAWLLYAVVQLAGADWSTAREFIAAPWNAGAFILLIINMLYHTMLGFQVIIEDYVHNAALEMALHLLVKGVAYGGMTLGIIFILQSALGA